MGSQSDSKIDGRAGSMKEGGQGRLCPPPSCGLAVIHVLQSGPTEIRNILEKRGNPCRRRLHYIS